MRGQFGAHARAHAEIQSADLKWHLRGFDDLGRHGLGVGQRAHAQQQHDKLVATQAGHGVRRADEAAQALREGLQHLIAHGVAMRIVDRLEAVEIDDQQGCLGLGAACAFESILELPHGYDLGQAKASYLNGFLRIEVPPVTPAPHPKSTKLPISDGKLICVNFSPGDDSNH